MIKKFFVFAVLLLVCAGANAHTRVRAKPSGVFAHQFTKDFRAEKVGPMLFLLQAIQKNPRQTRFILSFHVEAPMSTVFTKVNVDLKRKTLYLFYNDASTVKYLELYRGVTVEKIKDCHHKNIIYVSDTDNFHRLGDSGCPSKVLFLKEFGTNSAR